MYELFYGLNTRPFRMTPDRSCFCLSQSHKRALAHLKYGLQQAEGFVVFTGVSGTGKTLLLQVLITELESQNVQIANVSDVILEDADLLPTILSAFNKPIFEYNLRALISQLETFLLLKAEAGQRSVIIIDEAQNLSLLSLEILRLLSNLQYQKHAVLQIILVGDITLDKKISIPDNHLFRQRVTLSYQIKSMQFDDTKKYIMHRLTYAGWNGDPEIHEDVFTIIHRLSQGLPSEINRCCDRLLMQSMLAEKHVILGEDVNLLLAGDKKQQQIQSAIGKESKITPTVIDAVAEVKQTTAGVDNVEVTMENVYIEELEKEIETENDAHKHKAAIDKKFMLADALPTFILSYVASLFLAIALFYSDFNVPADSAISAKESISRITPTIEKLTSFAAVEQNK